MLRLEGFLSEQELDRRKEFTDEAAEFAFVAGRALVRLALSTYVSVSPHEWVFTENSKGKPAIALPLTTVDLKFNISHTSGLVGCAVASGLDVGLDIECLTRKLNLERLARRFFAEKEFESLLNLPANERRERFFMYWTLKESYMKARGVGMAMKLSKFAFVLKDVVGDVPEVNGVELDPSLGDNPSDWHFFLTKHGCDHMVASSVRTADKEVEFLVRDFTTLLPS
ncbi:MAG: 4'-phosphopantetheinyl transferase superfamily protein [Lentisphaerae bacterium]|nr:4'-phosphopantetheinyl transferase superfamily protein [Lentisphaerota bacterium]